MFHSIIRDISKKSDLPKFEFDHYHVYIFPWENDKFINLKEIRIMRDLKGVLYYQTNDKYIELICAFEIFKTPLLGILQIEKESKTLFCYLGLDVFTFLIFIQNVFKIPNDILQIITLEMYNLVNAPCPSAFQFYRTQEVDYLLNNNNQNTDALTETFKLNLKQMKNNEEFIKHLSRYSVLLKDGFTFYNNNDKRLSIIY